jgi:hypothetical protein
LYWSFPEAVDLGEAILNALWSKQGVQGNVDAEEVTRWHCLMALSNFTNCLTSAFNPRPRCTRDAFFTAEWSVFPDVPAIIAYDIRPIVMLQEKLEAL